MLDDFHFLRPLWLFALILVALVCFLLYRHKKTAKQWSSLIDAQLLNHLIKADAQRLSPLPIILIAVGGFVAVLALAGPSWEKLPQPQFVNQQPLVLLVDLSPSMAVEDVKPSRLIKMRFKLIDLLRARQQGLTALIVYAGDAHVLAPLSEDNETLISLVPTLSPQVMPISGSNTEEGVALAVSLLQAQSYNQANIILLTDGMTPQAAKNVTKLLEDTQYHLSIMGIGTAEGAPIPFSNKGFAKDSQGNIVLAKLDPDLLKKVAEQNAGIYQKLSLTNEDVVALLGHEGKVGDQYRGLEESNSQADKWSDAGQWLLLLLIPLALLGFRRGWVLQLVGVSFLITPLFAPSQAHAFEWQDLWKTQNQQAAMAYQQEDYKQAANKFNNPSWRGAAQFKAGDFSDSADSFSTQKNADGYYNQGNALAHLGKLEESISAFDKALLLAPEMADAKANKKIVEDLLAQKKQQEQQQGSEGDASKESESDQKQSNQDQSGDGSDPKNGENSGQDQSQQQSGSDSDSGEPKAERDSSETENASQNEQRSKSKESSAANEEKNKQAQLAQLKKEQQQKEQQALDKLNALQDQQGVSDQPSEGAQVSTQQPQKTSEQQQLENWLGQLPEDASRLVRNKFNYEYQKKRQAYINGQWQPPQEQRW